VEGGALDADTIEARIAASIRAHGDNARAFKEARRDARPLADVRRFAQVAERGALVLDVGCGPASDMRQLRDAGLKPVGVDMAWGALEEARLLLPKDPLVMAPFDDLPFRIRSFRGLWLNDAFGNLPRAWWRETFAALLLYVERGPVFIACERGNADLEPADDPVLGRTYRSSAHEAEIEALLDSHGLEDVQIELRPHPLTDRPRAWVVGHGRVL
jgi:SAM-dependent methyltransferase